MKLSSIFENSISINDLRRNFGEVEKALPFVDHFILTKKGKPFAILAATTSIKRELMKKTAGAFRGTALDKDNLWTEVLKKESRKVSISL